MGWHRVGQDKLTDYGRKYAAFTRQQVKKLAASGASTAELRAFQDQHDVPVDGLPSFVRIAWANQTAADQQKHIRSVTTASWPTLSAFDKILLGRPTSAKVSAGWVEFDKVLAQQKQELARQGRTFPSYGLTALAKYVGKYYAPRFLTDHKFSRQPLYKRLGSPAPIKTSANGDEWTSVLVPQQGGK